MNDYSTCAACFNTCNKCVLIPKKMKPEYIIKLREAELNSCFFWQIVKKRRLRNKILNLKTKIKCLE